MGGRLRRRERKGGSRLTCAWRWFTDHFQRRDEAVTAAGNRFDETRTSSRVSQRVTYLIDAVVEAVVEINEGVSRPEFLAEVLAADHLAGVFQQRSENLERLLLQTDFQSLLAKLPSPDIHLIRRRSAAPERS
jgi:hypothetical protein